MIRSSAGRADPRGFTDALAPLRHRQQWRLDGLRARLAALRRQIEAEESSLSELRERHRTDSAAVLQMLQQRVDPRMHRDALLYLVRLRHDIDTRLAGLRQLRHQDEEMRNALMAQQLKLDLLVRQREETLSAWLADATRRHAAEDEREWLARHAARPREGGA